MDELLALLVLGCVVAMVSAWVLLRAVTRIPREGLPVKEILKPTSMTLGAIWLAGWVVLSHIFGELLWAPVLVIPLTAPVAVFLAALLFPPDELQDHRGNVEYSHDYADFNAAGAMVIIVALFPQFWAWSALTQLGP